jgi:glutathione synthase/RimK-type ligase-like ATP-grasp enzyme
MHRITVPPEVGATCLRVASHLGLALAGLDLIRTPDDDWYFLEANPSPAFAFYPDRDDVASAIAELLITPIQSRDSASADQAANRAT